MRPTPWQIREARHEQADPTGGASRHRREDARLRAVLVGKRLRAGLDGNRGYLLAAIGCIITFVLLFQPWLTTNTGGTDGAIHANGFGRLHVATFWVDLWARSSVPNPQASGAWGILTSVAIGVAVCSVAVDSVVRTTALTYLATVATVFVAVFTIATALYLCHTHAQAFFPHLLEEYGGDFAAVPAVALDQELVYPIPGQRRI